MTDAIFSPEELVGIRAYRDPLYTRALVLEAVSLMLWYLWLKYFVRWFYLGSERCAGWLSVKLAAARQVPVIRAVPAAFDKIWKGPGWGTAILFPIAMCLFTNLIYLPSELYFDFFRERDFGLTSMGLTAYAWDYAKGTVIQLATTVSLVFGLLGLARRLPKWWLIVGAICSVGLVVSAAIDTYRERIYYDQVPLPAGELRDAINATMQKANIDFKDVLVEKTLSKSVRVQAYFSGKGPTRAIVVNDALLKEMTPAEVVAAIGHEAGHVNESRWPAQLASAVALLGFLFVIEQIFRVVARRRWWGVTERADVRTLPLIFIVFRICTETIFPISAMFQRQQELDADRYALELTGNTDAFRQMLIKAARVNKMDPDPPRWRVLKGWTHPPIRERIDAVDAWKRKTDGG